MLLNGFRIDPLVVHPRRPHRHRACRGEDFPLGVVAVTHHQAMTVLIELVSELGDIGRDLGLQSSGEHLPGTIADDLIEQRPGRTALIVGGGCVLNYREHGRTFPTGVGAPA